MFLCAAINITKPMNSLRNIWIISAYFVGISLTGQTIQISGIIEEASSGETMPNVSVVWESDAGGKSSSTNPYGFYSISIPKGSGVLVFSSFGYKEVRRQFENLNKNIQLNISLKEVSTELSEVNVVSEKLNSNITTTEMSVSKLSAKEIKKVPQLLGETDVIRTLTLLPGVSTVGEGASGFNVRGGNADQNLIILDEAPVYNSSHLFGFFSIFNADAVKDVKLYKGGMPANYGGRLSSVLDIRQKEGNSKKFAANGGIGLLSSRLTLEGPILKDKVNFMLAGRRSYFDLFFPLFNVPELDQSIAYFYDFNAKLNAKITKKDKIYLSAYFGRDQFSAAELFKFGWGNWTSTLRWNRVISPKWFFNASAVYSDYKYQLGADGTTPFEWDSRIRNLVQNAGWTFYYNNAHTFEFGVQNTFYEFEPAKISGPIDVELQNEYATEPSLYASDNWRITDNLTITYGLRYSSLYNIGARDIQTYKDGGIYNESTIDDTLSYSSGEIIKSFNDLNGLEPRVAINYQVSQNSSLKLSYNRNRQYIHLISNNTTATPVNVWRPAGSYIDPATVNQIALGVAHNFKETGIRFSIEGFYKTYLNLIDYKDGANLIFEEYIETELLSGIGRAYGAEVLLEKKTGALTGWVGYTLARTERQVTGSSRDLRVNNGEWYPANYDKLHDLSVVAAWTISKGWDVGGNFVYQSGRPLTYPDSRGEFEGIYYPVYTNRNGGRTPSTNRLDLSFTYTPGTKKLNKKWQSSLSFGAYNVYGRKNPYSIFFRGEVPEFTNIKAYQLSVIGTAVPYINYNFSF